MERQSACVGKADEESYSAAIALGIAVAPTAVSVVLSCVTVISYGDQRGFVSGGRYLSEGNIAHAVAQH